MDGDAWLCSNFDVMLVVQTVLVLESGEAVAEIMQLKTMPITGTDTVWLLSDTISGFFCDTVHG